MTLSRPIALALLAVAVAGCASVNARLAEGRRLSTEGHWRRAFEVFSEVRSRTCSLAKTDERCKEAIIGQAEAQLGLGDAHESYWLLARNQTYFPEYAADARIQAIQKEAQRAIGSRFARRSGHATLRVVFESNTTTSFTPQGAALTLDLIPISLAGLNDAKNGPVRGSTTTTAISPGEHEIEAVTKYASGGRLPAGYFIWVNHREKIEVADGDALELDVRFSERPTWSSSGEAIEATARVRHLPAAK